MIKIITLTKMQTLTFYERQRVEYYLRLKMGIRKISRRLRRNHSVISREVRRNRNKEEEYRATVAQRKADFHARKTNKRKLETNPVLHSYVERKLKEGWSPELIAGRLKNQSPKELPGMSISHEQIYEYIYEGKGRWEGWYHYLLRKRPKRRRKKGRKPHKCPIKERIPITIRPDIINGKKRFGDWESDLANYCKQKMGLSVQYERKGMVVRIHKVADKTAEENEQALTRTIEEFPSDYVLSITFDNGSENVCHTNIRDIFNVQTFFCRAYAAWQKGGVENAIGLVRRYLPRKTDLATLTEEEIYQVQEKINNRPRKKLSYRTPNEVLQELLSGALNS